jgi:hypothetical protein
MAELDVNFMHPTDGRLGSGQFDDTMTAQDVIAELVANNFIPHDDQGYALAIKGGNMLDTNQSFRDAHVKNGDILRVIPQTDAGRK